MESLWYQCSGVPVNVCIRASSMDPITGLANGCKREFSKKLTQRSRYSTHDPYESAIAAPNIGRFLSFTGRRGPLVKRSQRAIMAH